jgi:hypothetical protein
MFYIIRNSNFHSPECESPTRPCWCRQHARVGVAHSPECESQINYQLIIIN